jgi:hypothetical protein
VQRNSGWHLAPAPRTASLRPWFLQHTLSHNMPDFLTSLPLFFKICQEFDGKNE